MSNELPPTPEFIAACERGAVFMRDPNAPLEPFAPAEPDAGDVEARKVVGGYPSSSRLVSDLRPPPARATKAEPNVALTDAEKDVLHVVHAGGIWDDLYGAVETIVAARLAAVRRKAGDERAEQAWDEGRQAGLDDCATVPWGQTYRVTENPYRAARIAQESR